MDEYKLGDIFELRMGKTPTRNRSEYWHGTNQWVSISDLSFSKKYINITKDKITDLAVKETGIFKVPKGTNVIKLRFDSSA